MAVTFVRARGAGAATLALALAVSAACAVSVSGGGDASTTPAEGPLVVESTSCARCHAGSEAAGAMRDAVGRSVAPYDLWRSTMMANAARDPVWRAQVAAEVASTPRRAREIEATCVRCHAPMAHHAGLEDRTRGSLIDALDADDPLGAVGRDGASCVVCHGMLPDGLGTEATYSGRFELDPERRLFGPHEDVFPRPMRMFTGFTPSYGPHVTESALCGSCHTLFTETFEPDGRRTGETFAEQTPYLEWRNSAFDTERDVPGPRATTCQGCHLPTVDADGAPLATGIAHNPGGRDFPWIEPRTPYGRHLLVGGNVLGLSLLRDHAEELGVAAPRAAFDATIAATREQLRERTARVSIEGARRVHEEVGDELRFRVRVENLTGHKLPTGHPSRRAWLRATVRDAAGAAVFVSGGVDDEGRLVGPDGAPLPSELAGGPVAPHVDEVASPRDVARFRGVMADTHGAPTYRLVRAARWHVDDRLLPAGWRADHADAATTRPYGVEGDADFADGVDGVGYRVALPAGAQGPFAVEVELLHQTLSARWAAELATADVPAVHALTRMLRTADRTPELVARADAVVGG